MKTRLAKISKIAATVCVVAALSGCSGWPLFPTPDVSMDFQPPVINITGDVAGNVTEVVLVNESRTTVTFTTYKIEYTGGDAVAGDPATDTDLNTIRDDGFQINLRIDGLESRKVNILVGPAALVEWASTAQASWVNAKLILEGLDEHGNEYIVEGMVNCQMTDIVSDTRIVLPLDNYSADADISLQILDPSEQSATIIVTIMHVPSAPTGNYTLVEMELVKYITPLGQETDRFIPSSTLTPSMVFPSATLQPGDFIIFTYKNLSDFATIS